MSAPHETAHGDSIAATHTHVYLGGRRRPAIGVRRRRRREARVRLALVHVEPPQNVLAHLVRVVVVASCIQMLRDVVERLDDQRMLFAQHALAQLESFGVPVAGPLLGVSILLGVERAVV